MIQKEALLKIRDNSGAKLARCIFTYHSEIVKAGARVLCSLRKIVPK